MITRLQIGTSRLENLPSRSLQIFLDKTWIHLGDPRHENENGHLKKYSFFEVIKYFKTHIIYISKILFINNKKEQTKISEADITKIYSKTNFQEFYYQKGDRLPFDNNSISFIFSEHFFEHLFLDEALSLLTECYRILKPYGVIRTCVPDADLRTYEPPEPVGFPDINLTFENSAKHKTRWSVYSLGEAIKIAGFKAVPLHYCNKSGEYIKVNPSEIDSYQNCLEHELIFDFSYIKRIDSLIVDGLKRM